MKLPSAIEIKKEIISLFEICLQQFKEKKTKIDFLKVLNKNKFSENFNSVTPIPSGDIFFDKENINSNTENNEMETDVSELLKLSSPSEEYINSHNILNTNNLKKKTISDGLNKFFFTNVSDKTYNLVYFDHIIDCFLKDSSFFF